MTLISKFSRSKRQFQRDQSAKIELHWTSSHFGNLRREAVDLALAGVGRPEDVAPRVPLHVVRAVVLGPPGRKVAVEIGCDGLRGITRDTFLFGELRETGYSLTIYCTLYIGWQEWFHWFRTWEWVGLGSFVDWVFSHISQLLSELSQLSTCR